MTMVILHDSSELFQFFLSRFLFAILHNLIANFPSSKVPTSAHGKRADPAKVDTLLAMKTPQNVSEAKYFVGLVQEHAKGLA